MPRVCVLLRCATPQITSLPNPCAHRSALHARLSTQRRNTLQELKLRMCSASSYTCISPAPCFLAPHLTPSTDRSYVLGQGLQKRNFEEGKKQMCAEPMPHACVFLLRRGNTFHVLPCPPHLNLSTGRRCTPGRGRQGGGAALHKNTILKPIAKH